MLCPNCHTKTNTYCRNKKIKKSIQPKPSEINPDWRKTPRPDSHKVPHPSKEELEKLLWEISTSKIAKQFGVSDKAIEKWAKSYGIKKPPRGYWAKKQ